ncbi:MAG: hypothetical protein QOF57_1728, partial [Frankiaceae bacterium]|nr:hypothetical protein [Frankiaceae bacterium]
QKLLGKPAATYLLTPSWAGEIASVVSQAASSQVTEEIAGVDTAIKTTQDDGTILYSLAVLDPSVNPPAVGGPPAVAFNLDIHTTAENVVIGQTITASDPTYGTTISATQTDSYGAQQITLPAASDTVTSADVRRALNAIHLPQIVHDTASRVAQAAATLARHAHRPISAGDVVLAAKQVVAGAPVRISVTRIKGGVRLSSVNPFTHRTVSNSVVVELAAVVHA